MITSIELLPQSADSDIKGDVIKLLFLHLKYTLLGELEQAIRYFFLEKDLRKFDPHVGETSCQIRACQILALLDEMAHNRFYHQVGQRMEAIASTKLRILDLIALIKSHKLSAKYSSSQRKENLHSFLEEHGCFLMLHPHEFFLLHACLLTKFRKVNGIGDTCMDYEKIYAELNLSKALGRKLVHVYQRRLAEWSCQFVKEKLQQASALTELQPVIQYFECHDDDSRKVLPCFHMTEVLLQYLSQNRKNIAIVVERRHKIAHLDTIMLFFKVNGDGEYTYSPKVNNTPCFMVYGTMVYQESAAVETHQRYIGRFIKAGVINVLLSNMAIHPQYTGLCLAPYRNDPYRLVNGDEHKEGGMVLAALKERYLHYHHLATNLGCGKNNAELLFIRHINCDRPLFGHSWVSFSSG